MGAEGVILVHSILTYSSVFSKKKKVWTELVNRSGRVVLLESKIGIMGVGCCEEFNIGFLCCDREEMTRWTDIPSIKIEQLRNDNLFKK